MRVITGSARGMRLKTLEGDNTRPTSEKVKEAVFSSIQFDIEGRRVLDLFAGSGQMGIEALSRGAVSAAFVDSSKEAIKIIKENIEKTGFTAVSSVVQMEAVSFLRMNTQIFDIAFIDPPYAAGLSSKVLSGVEDYIAEGGIVIYEHSTEETLPDETDFLKKQKDYKYGKTTVTLYRKG